MVGMTVPGLPVSVDEPSAAPTAQLAQNFPNPTTSATTIQYSLASPGRVVMTLYSVDGRELRHLVESDQMPGSYSVNLDAASLPDGIYFYTLRTSGGWSQTKQLDVRR